jgi:WD40 repeat protein
MPQRPGAINPDVPAALDRICLRALAWEPKDRFSSMKEFAQALSAASFEPPPAFKLSGHLQRPRRVVIAAEKPMAVSTSKDKTVRVWDLTEQRKLGQLLHNAEFVYDVAVTASGSLIAGAGSDGSLYLWQWPQTKPVAKLSGHTGGVYCVSLTPDGKHLITGGRDTAVRVWDIESRKVSSTIDELPERVLDVAVSPDGQLVAVACPGSSSEASPPSCKSVWLVPLTGQGECREFRGHEAGVSVVTFSADGRYLASGTRNIWKSGIYQPSEDRNILIWDVDTGEIVQHLVTDGDGFTSLLFTPDGRRLISRRVLHRHDDRSLEDDPMIAIWDVASGRLLKHFPGGEAVTCSPNGDYILYSALDASLRAIMLSELLGAASSP